MFTTLIPEPVSRREWTILSAAAALLCLIYLPLMVSEPILGRDDRTMLNVLEAVNQTGYWKAFAEGQTLDVQPLRDLSLWVDGQIEAALSYRVYHVTQMLLWLGCGAMLHCILRALGATSLLRTGLTCLFLFHPATMACVGWMASRKHLLACLFLSAATWRVVCWETRTDQRGWRQAVYVSLLYLCAMASQPLGICWPVWVAWFLYARGVVVGKRFALVLCACLTPITIATAWLNYRYYVVLYPLKHGSHKYFDADLLSHFLALGRYFTQLIAPISLSPTPYLPRSPLNFFGLAALVCLTIALSFSNKARKHSVWLALFFLSIAPVTATMTNIFGSDTYLLIPLVSICAWVADVSPARNNQVDGHIYLLAMGGMAVVFAAVLGMHVGDWMTDAQFWRASYREGPTADNMTHVAFYDLKEGFVEDALALSQKVYAVSPHERNLGLVLPEAIFKSADPVLDIDRKLEMLTALRMKSPWPNFYAALLHARKGDYDAAWALMEPLLAGQASFGDRRDEVLAAALQVCLRAQGRDCELKVGMPKPQQKF